MTKPSLRESGMTLWTYGVFASLFSVLEHLGFWLDFGASKLSD